MPIEEDKVKAESAKIFQEKYYLVKNDEVYNELKKLHKEQYENGN